MEIIINNKKFNLDVADCFTKRLLGLMGKNNINKGIFFPRTNAVHTFFMRDNIDIIMVNENNKVIYFEKNIKKNRIIIKRKAYHTIELPKNSINSLKVGDKLLIIN